MLNHIVIMGRLTHNPEASLTQAGIHITRFTLAVERDFKAREGDGKETDFLDCVAWRNTAEFVYRHFTKGMLAAVSGRLQIREWTDKEGHKRRNAEIVVDNAYFGEPRRTDATPAATDAAAGPAEYEQIEADDALLPF